MKKNQPDQTPAQPICGFPVEHEQGECPCFDDFGECPNCGAAPGVVCGCPEEPWEFEMDPEEEAAYAAWQEEICKEGEEAERILKPFLRKHLPREVLLLLAGPCPDTPTFVAYQQGDLPPLEAEELTRKHVIFCPTCLQELKAIGRADDVEYDPERDYDPHAVLPPSLLQCVRSNHPPTS